MHLVSIHCCTDVHWVKLFVLIEDELPFNSVDEIGARLSSHKSLVIDLSFYLFQCFAARLKFRLVKIIRLRKLQMKRVENISR